MTVKPDIIGFLYEIVPFSAISKFVKIGIIIDIMGFVGILA